MAVEWRAGNRYDVHMTNLPITEDFFCTDVSLALNEPMVGTAVHVGVWLLLEVNEAWRAQATTDNDLPPRIQAWLDAQLAAVENGRLQFIKQGPSYLELAELSFYVAVNDETNPVLYEFTLHDYDELLALDVPAMVAGDDAYAAHVRTTPLTLVCTNGTRDRCCAKFGLPLYDALSERLGADVWQTTHTGGHRFAATLLTFPDGASYGRLSLDDVDDFVAHLQRGELLVEKLRGRTCYGPVGQIADYFLRHETGEVAPDAFQHVRTTAKNGRFTVHFRTTDKHQQYRIILQQQPEPLRVYASSGSFKIKEVPQYKLVDIEMSLQ